MIHIQKPTRGVFVWFHNQDNKLLNNFSNTINRFIKCILPDSLLTLSLRSASRSRDEEPVRVEEPVGRLRDAEEPVGRSSDAEEPVGRSRDDKEVLRPTPECNSSGGCIKHLKVSSILFSCSFSGEIQ